MFTALSFIGFAALIIILAMMVIRDGIREHRPYWTIVGIGLIVGALSFATMAAIASGVDGAELQNAGLRIGSILVGSIVLVFGLGFCMARLAPNRISNH